MTDESKQEAFLEKPERLHPNGCARIVIFWLPLVVVMAVLTYVPGFQTLPLWARILIYTTALWLSGYVAFGWQMKPLPTEAELAMSGGRRFVRPSDGNVIEYWVSGSIGSKRVVAFCHRMDGKQGADYGHDQVQQLLRESNACLVSPSCPACSGSPAYDTDSPVQWLKQYREDWVALLEHLGAEDVYVTGVSFGAQLAASLAEELKKHGKLRACAPIGGWWFNTKTHNYFNSPGASLLCNGLLMRPLYYCFWSQLRSMSGNLEQMAKQMSSEDGEAELKYVRRYWGMEDLTSWDAGGLRVHDYFRTYALQYTRLGFAKEADDYVDWKAFDDPAVPFVLWYADNGGDKMVTLEAQAKIQANVGPKAQLKLYEGTHCGFPLHDVIKGMFGAKR